MAITERQKKLVRESFAKVVPISETAADIFYTKLFEYDPALRGLFKSPMKTQGKMLMATLKTAVDSLDDLNALVPVLQALADRHVKYGVKVDDYTPVGNALLYALKVGLGPDWNPELRSAWISVYNTVAEVMRTQAYPDFDPTTYKNTKRYNRAL